MDLDLRMLLMAIIINIFKACAVYQTYLVCTLLKHNEVASIFNCRCSKLDFKKLGRKVGERASLPPLSLY